MKAFKYLGVMRLRRSVSEVMGKRKAEPEGEDLVVHVDHYSSWNHQS